jgi:hypothetical protein
MPKVQEIIVLDVKSDVDTLRVLIEDVSRGLSLPATTEPSIRCYWAEGRRTDKCSLIMRLRDPMDSEDPIIKEARAKGAYCPEFTPSAAGHKPGKHAK